MLSFYHHSTLKFRVCFFIIVQSLISSNAVAQTNEQINVIKGIVIEEAIEYGVDPSLALAIAKVESNFDPKARSDAGAKGVMQIMPNTAKTVFGVSPRLLYNARVNIRLGVRFIKQLLDKYNQDVNIALSHYNGGSAVKDKNGRLRVIPATSAYVEKVQTLRRSFQQSTGNQFEHHILAQKSPYRYLQLASNSDEISSKDLKNEIDYLKSDTPVLLSKVEYKDTHSTDTNEIKTEVSDVVKVTPTIKDSEFKVTEAPSAPKYVRPLSDVTTKLSPNSSNSRTAGVKIRGPRNLEQTYAQKIETLQALRVHNIMRNSNKHTASTLNNNNASVINTSSDKGMTKTARKIDKVQFMPSQPLTKSIKYIARKPAVVKSVNNLENLSDKRKKVLQWESIY